MTVVRDVSLRVARGSSLCLVGPNGAGKSTVLNAIYGFARIFSGAVTLSGRDIAKLPPSDKLKTARLAYVLQRGSVFPDMTVEENLLMGGYLLDRPSDARQAAERVLSRYPALQARRREARQCAVGQRAAAAENFPRADHGSGSGVDRRAIDRARAPRHRHDLRHAAHAARRRRQVADWSSKMPARVSNSPTLVMCWWRDDWSGQGAARNCSPIPTWGGCSLEAN